MIQGQILPESLFGESIKKIILEEKPNTILEIGTWKGLGSTKVIIDSIIESNYKPKFISLESNKNFYDIAKNNLNPFLGYVDLLYGRIIEKSVVEEFVSENVLTDEMVIWLNNDLNDYLLCDNILNKLPNSIDFLLLDGGEFSTYCEWSVLKNRSKIVVLDDTLVLKCKKIREELLGDNNYELIIDNPNDRNGFSIFKKI
jgi:hypothetical protein